MKKENLQKKIALIALTGLLGSGLLLCTKEQDLEIKGSNELEETISFDELLKEEENKEIPSIVHVEDKNRNWKNYSSLNRLLYHTEDGNLKMIFMVPDDKKENKTIYKSITNPSISFVLNENDQYLENNSLLNKEEFSYNNIPLFFTTYQEERLSYNTALKKEQEFANTYEQKVTIAEDANKDWKMYQEIVQVVYEVEITGEKQVITMGLESRNRNQVEEKRIYRGLDIPEVTLVETQDLKTYEITYEFSKNDLLLFNKKEWNQNINVIDIVGRLGGSYTLHYEEILENQEQYKEQNLNNKNLKR